MSPGKCDGQTTYGTTVLDNLVDQIIRIQLERIQHAPPQALLQKQHDREVSVAKARVKLLNDQYQQKQRDYQDLRAETLKVIQGTSRLNVDLLNSSSTTALAFSRAAFLLSWAWIALSILATSFTLERGVTENTLR